MSAKNFVLENSIPMLSTFSEGETLLRAEGGHTKHHHKHHHKHKHSNAGGDFVADSQIKINDLGISDSSELKLSANFSEPELFSNATSDDDYLKYYQGLASGATTVAPASTTPSSSSSKPSGLDKLTNLVKEGEVLIGKGSQLANTVKGFTDKGKQSQKNIADNSGNNNKKKGISAVTIAIIGGAVVITVVASYFLFVHKSAPKVAAVV